VHEEEVQGWGKGRKSLKKERDTVGRLERPKRACGNVSQGPTNHCSFVTRKINMW
jgi:hypothetical protein